MSEYAAGLWSLNGDGMVIVETWTDGERVSVNQYALDDALAGSDSTLDELLRDAARHGDADWTIEHGDGSRYVDGASESVCLGGYQSSADWSNYGPPAPAIGSICSTSAHARNGAARGEVPAGL